ncbi:hypothetical protein JW935_17425, partial [candidate division KSB1 bacterium]|nr:hypothetical protein [candidate division KSB1 bacterium]
DMDAFLEFYHYDQDDLHEHWSGDEDQDWTDGLDKNNNGTYSYLADDGLWYIEPGEYAGDDVGLDGVGPADINYNGPDEGECNHMPDFIEGVGCEPNFAFTDVSEADMVGLTAFAMFDWPTWQEWNIMLGQDKVVWELMDSHNLGEYKFFRSTSSLYEVFASTSFPFYKGRTERISMGMLFAYENLSTIRASSHYAPKIFRLKETAQVIYERDYRFAQPPLMPTLSATAGDGKVILTWDDLSDRRTHEPFLQNINDFEGYKLYRATDKMFSDPEVITTGQGDKAARLPLFQCDIADRKTGYAEYGLVEGMAFYLGDDTGIRHYFIDDDVQNGVTYYYAVVAYDYGVEDLGVSPTENNIVIELDEAEEIVRIGQNVAVVTPHPRAAGYTAPDIVIDETATSSTILPGSIIPELVDVKSVQPNHTYKVTFLADTVGHLRTERYRYPLDAQIGTSGFKVWDITSGRPKPIYEESPESFTEDHLIYDSDLDFWFLNMSEPVFTDIIDGFQLQIAVTFDSVEVDWAHSGWITGQAPIFVTSGYETRFYPYSYEIHFTGGDEQYQTKTTTTSSIKHTDGTNLSRRNVLLENQYDFYVINKSAVDSMGNYEKLDLLTYDVNENGVYEWDQDIVLAGYCIDDGARVRWSGTIFSIDFRNVGGEEYLPKANDVFQVRLKRPFTESDSLVFTVNPEVIDEPKDIRTTMDSIRVVPNPYIATNAMETAVANKFLNQRRRIIFTHIPAKCEIRIFTSSGVLVDEIFVNNEPTNGLVHWDLLSREGLEIAAGMYIYHVKSTITGDEQIGKFAVIK